MDCWIQGVYGAVEIWKIKKEKKKKRDLGGKDFSTSTYTRN
jgi:hypothetical protein